MQSNSAPHHRTLLRLGLALIYLTPLAIFAKLAFEVRDGRPVATDIRILEWIHGFASPARDHIMIAVTNLGGVGAVSAFTIIAATALLALRRRHEMAVLLIGVGGAAALNLVLKPAFGRVRPSLWLSPAPETNFSFPSGHAMLSSALAFTTVYLLWHTRWRWAAIIIAIMYTGAVGFSRLYLGVHYPTDVIGGWALSFIWLVVVARIIAKAPQRLAKPVTAER